MKKIKKTNPPKVDRRMGKNMVTTRETEMKSVILIKEDLRVLHNQEAKMEMDKAAGRISIVKTSLGYTYGIGPSPMANKLIKINVNIKEIVARIIHLDRTSYFNQVHTDMNFDEYT